MPRQLFTFELLLILQFSSHQAITFPITMTVDNATYTVDLSPMDAVMTNIGVTIL
ncbi:hypothetical protein PC128_g20857 [Phytophthora cactorum]|nr:hypothetical protein PC120_g21320 [Phytophthora cactorum]KAG3161167.1 hypothetical protein PC128_g20857 [Phytophthora cactorum]KAG4042724.1 hypothetical protein PC123_g21792 [Phytophthora cactorum]